MSEDLKINITTTADTGGAKAAATALGEVAVASKKGGDAAKDQGKKVNEMGESFEKASAAGRMLGEVSTGNIAAFGQFGAVIKAVGQSFKTNPLFMIGTIAAMTILPVFKKLSEGWDAQKKAAEEAGKAVEEAMQKARDAIATKQDNAIAKAYADIAAAAELANKWIHTVTTSQIAQIDADEAVAIAMIDNNEALSNEEKLLQKTDVQHKARAGRTSAKIASLNSQDQTADGVADDSEKKAQERRRIEASMSRQVDLVASRSPEQIKQELKANQEARQALFSDQRVGGPKNLSTEDYMAKKSQLEQRNADLQSEAAKASTDYAPALAKAQEAFKAAIEKRVAAEEAAAKAAADALTGRKIHDKERETLTVQQAADDKVAKANATTGLRLAKDKDTAQQTANDEADVHDGLLNNARHTLGNASSGVRAIGEKARKGGDKATEALALDALNKINATRDGATDEEASQGKEALANLLAALAEKNQASANLKATVKLLTDQMNAITAQIKNGKTNN